MSTEAVRNPFVQQLSLSPETTPAAATSKGKHLGFLNFPSLYQMVLVTVIWIPFCLSLNFWSSSSRRYRCVFYNWLGLSLAILLS